MNVVMSVFVTGFQAFYTPHLNEYYKCYVNAILVFLNILLVPSNSYGIKNPVYILNNFFRGRVHGCSGICDKKLYNLD